jgi:uncharacterized repeat protein (TIGR01451 family)
MPANYSLQSPKLTSGLRPLKAFAAPDKFTFRQISRRLTVAVALFVLGSSIASSGWAKDQTTFVVPAAQTSKAEATVQAVLTQRKVVRSPEGVEKLEDASTVKPGDVIEYQVVYTNSGPKPVTGFVAELPIPEGLAYLPRSATPGESRVRAATKDGVYSAEPLTRNVAGKSEKIPYGDYRSLRWTLGQIPSHGVTTVSARAQVEAVVPVLPLSLEKRPPANAAESRNLNTR